MNKQAGGIPSSDDPRLEYEVVLDPDVASVFEAAGAVDSALRSRIATMPRGAGPR